MVCIIIMRVFGLRAQLGLGGGGVNSRAILFAEMNKECLQSLEKWSRGAKTADPGQNLAFCEQPRKRFFGPARPIFNT